MSYGCGWHPDEPDFRDFNSTVICGDGEPARTFAPASLRAYKQSALFQNGYSACVAYAVARALHISLLVEDERNGRPLSASVPSPGFIYYNARRQETVDARADGRPDLPVLDKGSFARLALRGAQAVGYCREVDYPFEMFSRDISDFPNDNRKPPAKAYLAAYDQRNLRYSRVYPDGSGRQNEVARLLGAKVPVIFGMTVDEGFMRNAGEVITAIDPARRVGGHMLCVLEAREEGVVFDNWWGTGWGNGGEGILSWDLFNSSVIGDVYAIEAAPRFSSEEP